MKMPMDAMNDLSDDVLLALYANGERTAAVVLTNRLTPVVLSLAYRLLGDRTEAEDIAQEAMLRLWKIAPNWRQGEAKVTTWLYRVVSNLCADRHRRSKGLALDDVAEPTDTAPGVEQRMQRNERARALRYALNDLPERQRQAVVMRHLAELRNPEIAQILGISVEAVESLISRGKRHLKAKLCSLKKPLGLEE
jgi:RNA polymerase sigma-70 factor (ECF subfamily)